MTFRISPFSFFQTNTHGAEKLFSTAFAMLGHIEGDILDLYCGTGSIGLSLLALGNTPLQKGGRSAATGGSKQQLIGIEIVEEAIVDALHNAKINGLQERCSFIASPAEKIAISPEIWKADVLPCQGEEPVGRRGLKDLDVVVIDPPRDGLHKNVIEWIVNLKKEQDFKLLYISCNPVTMARDVEMFLEAGFKLKEVQAVDMFPHTHHVECVGVLG